MKDIKYWWIKEVKKYTGKYPTIPLTQQAKENRLKILDLIFKAEKHKKQTEKIWEDYLKFLSARQYIKDYKEKYFSNPIKF